MIVKVCGMRDPDNIRAIEKSGSDWMGFIFYPQSPRYVARKPAYLPEHTKRIGVFVSPTFEEVMTRVKAFGLHGVQLHGKVWPEECLKLRQTGLTVIRALPADGQLNDLTAPFLGCVDYFLFDTPTDRHGGSGSTLDWQILSTYLGHVPFLLSGGISPASVPKLAYFAHPLWQGIDLNSRFETQPGLKSPQAIGSFINAFRALSPQNGIRQQATTASRS